MQPGGICEGTHTRALFLLSLVRVSYRKQAVHLFATRATRCPPSTETTLCAPVATHPTMCASRLCSPNPCHVCHSLFVICTSSNADCVVTVAPLSVCSAAFNKANRPQTLFRCRTCWADTPKHVCKRCAEECHKDHLLKYVESVCVSFFVNCSLLYAAT